MAVVSPLIGGCTVHEPNLEPAPLVEAAPGFNEAPPESGEPAAETPAAPGDAGDAPQWWLALGDEMLGGLIDEALESNLELRQLGARLGQASALLRQAGSRLLPALDAAAEYSASWLDEDDSRGGTEFGDHDDSASAGLVLSWELDVWGRLRSAQEGARLDTEAALDDWYAGRLLLSAVVAETYFEAIEQRLQLRLVAEQIDTNTTLLELTRLRFGQAQASIVDVLQQQEQLASTQALVPLIEARLETLEYSLDVLLGRAPGGRERLETRELAAPPPLPALGVPADLLAQRPDVRAARSRLIAADYRVGEAIADRLPRLTVGGSLAETGTPRLDTPVGTLFAQAIAPLFDGGLRRAEVELRRARLEELALAFSRTYLLAVQEVETAILQERKGAERVKLLDDELAIARQLLNETKIRYSQGLTDYLPVLAAVVRLQDLERALITSRRELLTLRVALHRALGGSTIARDADRERKAGDVVQRDHRFDD
jgi:NodT family efflux transporter outer membrane factor (OMF) lipoprotein